jgi:hypothetical protein
MVGIAIVIFSTFGAVSGVILVGPRVYFAMARDGLLFRWIAAVSIVVLCSVIAIARVWSTSKRPATTMATASVRTGSARRERSGHAGADQGNMCTHRILRAWF